VPAGAVRPRGLRARTVPVHRHHGRDFRLSDPDGRVRTLADFSGQVVPLFFTFTQCPDV
jgi:cytochrome oxidase Cu insertion factor (SCO1/SenC/PrrC family)